MQTPPHPRPLPPALASTELCWKAGGRELQSCSDWPRNLGSCSPPEWQQGHGEPWLPNPTCRSLFQTLSVWGTKERSETAAKDKTLLSSSPCRVRAVIIYAWTCSPFGLLLSSHISVTAFLPTARSAFPRDALDAILQKGKGSNS